MCFPHSHVVIILYWFSVHLLSLFLRVRLYTFLTDLLLPFCVPVYFCRLLLRYFY